MKQHTDAITSGLKQIKLLLLDVDGVLTRGDIIYGADGGETKAFYVRDGLGIRFLMESGIHVGIVTGRSSEALLHRCKNLGIDLIFDGVRDKAKVLNDIIEKTGISPEEMAFIGDDLVDIPLLKRVGIAVAVADAHDAVKKCATMVTAANGGAGAVREFCEAVLTARGLWDKILERFNQ
ncbi:MAG: HAD-IIIA family hydrolase [Desulfobacterales bacterium]|nr:HAD-IIIA family hydrolase [Desulfobacterales bacterium]